MFKEFTEKVSVTEDKKTAMVTVSFEHYSPIVAKRIVESYVATINEFMRQRKINESEKNIKYLNTQVESTANNKMKEIFYNIIQEQLKNTMIAQASPEYVFKTVSKAMIPAEKSKPVRSQIIILFTLLGLLFSTLLVYILHYNNYRFNKILPVRL